MCKNFHLYDHSKPFFSVPFRAELEVNSDALKAVQRSGVSCCFPGPMSLARIITRLPEASRHLVGALQARGFKVETRSARDDSAPPTDLEIFVEECGVEEALQRASLEAGPHGCVFIGPGAIADDFRPIAVIPLLPNVARETRPEKEWIPERVISEEPIPEFEVLPAANAPEAVPVADIVEPEIAKPLALTVAPTLIPAEPAIEPLAARVDAASIGDLAARLQTGESDSEANLETETTSLEEVPASPETQTIPAVEAAGAKVFGTTPEIRLEEFQAPELSVPEVQLLEGSLALKVASNSEPIIPLDLPAAPGIPLADVEEVAPIVCEERRSERDVTIASAVKPESPVPVQPTLAKRVGTRKVRISFPHVQRSFYYWAAAALATVIAVEALVLMSAAPALPRASKPESQKQQLLQPQAQNVTTATKAVPARKPNAEHRSVRATDEGYVAKNTVIHYGSRPATSPTAKSTVKTRSVQN